MSTSNIIIGILALALMTALYGLNHYIKEVQDLRTELVITRNNMETMRSQVEAYEKANRERKQAQEEIDNVAQERSRLLDLLPSGWGDRPLPDECVRMFHYDPDTSVGSDSPSGGTDGAD